LLIPSPLIFSFLFLPTQLWVQDTKP
jgi:hypothetical protein